MRSRRQFISGIATVGTVAIAGCASSESGSTDEESEPSGEASSADQTNAESLVEDYYTAIVNGHLSEAASSLALTQIPEGGGSVEQTTEVLREKGMSQNGTDASLGEFKELSVSEFAQFTFLDENGVEQQYTEQEVAELLPTADGFGGDEEPVTLVHHTGGFLSDVWLPYQPTEEPDTGWGEVVIEVGPFSGELFIIGDFRTYTSRKVVK